MQHPPTSPPSDPPGVGAGSAKPSLRGLGPGRVAPSDTAVVGLSSYSASVFVRVRTMFKTREKSS